MNSTGAEPSLVTTAPGTARFYSPQLDGLRFLAALLVFVHHAPALPLLGAVKRYGWAGVDMFLCISAFLITRLILLEHYHTGSFSLRSFFIRRALRIWPLYLGYASVICLASFLVGLVPAKTAVAWWLSHISFSNNVLTAVKGYSPVAFSSHLWTISLEEQAYLTMPLLLAVFIASGEKKRTAVLFCLSAVMILVVVRSALALAQTPHPFIWVLPLRGDDFFIGSLAAIVTHRRRAHVRTAPLFAVGALLLATLPLWPPFDKAGVSQTIGYTVLAVGCTSIVIACFHSSVAKLLLGFAPIRYLGKISYGIYVYHLAGIFVATKLLDYAGTADPLVIFALALTLTVATAALSYRVWERPFLLLKERFTRVQSRAT